MSHHAFLVLISYVVNAVWQVAILAAAAWLLSRLAKPAGPELQHKIWVATLILATLAPATPVIQSYFAHVSTRAVGSPPPALAMRPSSRPVAPAGADIILPPAALYLISGLYITALLFCLLRLCRMLRRTVVLVRNAGTVSTEPDCAELWRKSKERLSVPAAALLQSPNVAGPVTAGFRRPVLLLPATFLQNHSQTEFLAAIAHECAHIQRDDFRKNVLYEAVGLFTVFHPLTWFIKSQIAQTREMICDRMAAEQLPDRRAYAHSLLQLAGKMHASTPAVSHAMGMFDAGILETRIVALISSMPRVSRVQRYLWSVTAILLLSICAGGIGLMARTVAAQTASPSAEGQSSTGKKQTGPELSCTYYEKGVGSDDASCGRDNKDKTTYRCYLNSDPAKSNPQAACEWKVLRYEDWRKKQ
jgi:beta-lactamase regulating signal transducer with metallopeptidase domain